jgi:hypothetical protein
MGAISDEVLSVTPIISRAYSSIRARVPVFEKVSHLPWLTVLEISSVIVFSMLVGRDFLDMSPDLWPPGREFGLSIHPHFIWTQLLECGSCILWNGYYNGGMPAFSNLHAPVLHPLVVFSTLIWGAIHGAKIVIVGSLAIAGIGQWWLARVLGLSLLPRIWSAALVVTAGHLAGRLSLGLVGIIVATATCCLVLAPGLMLAQSGKRRHAIGLGIVLALVIVSGSGYMQFGLALAILPAFAVFILDDHLKIRPVWKEFLLAGLLGVLLAGIFLIPMLHFMPQFAKDVDPTFGSAQPIKYVPLSFVIDDLNYYFSSTLEKLPFPDLYVNYIGWIPVVLAFLPLVFVRPAEKRKLIFFWLAIFLVLLVSSASILKIIFKITPTIAAMVRFPAYITGLAVPLILGLAAWGIDRILRYDWPSKLLSPSYKPKFPGLLRVISGVIVLLVLSISVVFTYQFSQHWLYTVKQSPGPYRVIDAAQTPDSQWVSMPHGEHFWAALAADAGLKLTNQFRPSRWKERQIPEAFIEGDRRGPRTGNPGYLGQIDGISLTEIPENTYAAVYTGYGRIPCQAKARGGYIDVTCENDKPGVLMVQENLWSGWQVKYDGLRVNMADPDWQDSVFPMIEGGPWLATFAPAGLHQYEFRYRPWDIWVGLLLTVGGIGLALWMWRHPEKPQESMWPGF